jgi:hypothetical protein
MKKERIKQRKRRRNENSSSCLEKRGSVVLRNVVIYLTMGRNTLMECDHNRRSQNPRSHLNSTVKLEAYCLHFIGAFHRSNYKWHAEAFIISSAI